VLVGKRLKDLRKSKNISQEDLGRLINVTKVSICCYENEKRTPNLETFVDLTKIFNVSADYLLGNDILIKSTRKKDAPAIAVLSDEDVKIVNEIKSHRDLYKKLIDDPKRTVDLIAKRIREF
jgi:transcriptional regulator with XRE-family HTH domain